MKLKSALGLLGFRGAPKRYGYEIKAIDVPGYGAYKYAQWKHPYEGQKTIEASQVREYQKFIQPGDFCIDIGAHSGDSTLPMAIAATKEGLTLAVEPNPYVYTVLEKNIRLNRNQLNIDSMMVAAAAEESHLELEYSDPGFCNGGRHEGMSVFTHGHIYKLLAQAVNLSDELRNDYSDYLPRLKFIKVDAEGFDLHILRNLSDVVDEFRPHVKAEVFLKTNHDYRQQMLKFFEERGYHVYQIAADDDLWGKVLTEDSVSAQSHYDIFCVPQEADQLARAA